MQKNKSPSSARLPQVAHIIAVASAKGGVGKSTVSLQLALALSQMGYKVGLFDADLHGPSLATMLGVEYSAESAGAATEQPHLKKAADVQQGTPLSLNLQPTPIEGLQLVSMGTVVPAKTALSWRGPVASKYVLNWLFHARWQPLDYLLIDMPPGTSDIAMTLARQTPLTGVVIVTTPQRIAQIDVERGIEFFKTLSVPILGLVENMSHYLCDHCGQTSEPSSYSAGKALAATYQLPLLEQLPIDGKMAEALDNGKSLLLQEADHPISLSYHHLAKQLLAQVEQLDVS